MGVQVNGPKIIFTIPIFGGIDITESIVNMWIIMAVIVALCIWLTRGLKVVPTSKKQIVAEKLVDMLYTMVKDTMGVRNLKFAPYIGTLFTASILGSLSSLLTMRPYTADFSVSTQLGAGYIYTGTRYKYPLPWHKGLAQGLCGAGSLTAAA